MGQSEELVDHFRAGTKTQHAIDFHNLFRNIIDLAQQTDENVTIDGDRTPRDAGVVVVY